MASLETMQKYVTENEAMYLGNETVVTAKAKAKYQELKGDNEETIKKKYNVITAFKAKLKRKTVVTEDGTETTAEVKQNVIQINELLNNREIKSLFKHLKISFDKSKNDSVIELITELNKDLTSFIATSEQRKIESLEQELLRQKQEIAEKDKEIDNQLKVVADKKKQLNK
ncbi:hypothetical protein EZS27_008307 [termite gut metagenome]|uniref:Uncharacterized protein n=1 Tax=termite gut metagenome TaxID=433724 RepID=A0A5J4SFE8_9ZZZZ